tara:strand:- start:6234 stop:6452 length:219 start_codon:yes stop_codon:yes gene_type:complete
LQLHLETPQSLIESKQKSPAMQGFFNENIFKLKITLKYNLAQSAFHYTKKRLSYNIGKYKRVYAMPLMPKHG